MARRKQQVQPERWITAKEATAILRQNSERDDIPVSYIRILAAKGHVKAKHASEGEGLDGRSNLYLASEVESYKVQRRGVKGSRHLAGSERQQEDRAVA